MIAPLLLMMPVGQPKITTLFFVTSDCPIAQRYTPEIKRIMKEYQDISRFEFVYEDLDAKRSDIDHHHAEFKIKCPWTIDRDRSIAKRFTVKAVPTAVVKDERGEIRYNGRIDDAYGNDFRWHPAKKLDLRNALQAIRMGKPVLVKTTSVVGCSLSY